MGGISNQFSWSKTRAQSLQECKRQYYYQYYAYWDGWLSTAPDLARRLYRLRSLDCQPTWQGRVIHEALQGALKQLHALQAPPSFSEVVSHAFGRIDVQWRTSCDKAYWTLRVKDPNWFGLIEHETGTSLDEDTPWLVKARTANALANVYSSDLWRNVIVPSDPQKWLGIDERTSFALHGTRVWAVPDLTFRARDGLLYLVDWKTGRPQSEADRLQLAAYAAYAHVEREVPLDQLRVVLAFTRGARLEYDAKPVILDDLKQFAQYAKTSIDEMTTLLEPRDDPEQTRAANVPRDIECFTKTTNPAACQRCNFRTVCYPNDSNSNNS